MEENRLRKLVAANIKRARKELGITQKELGKRANYSGSYIGDIETAATPIEIERLALFSRILNKPVIYFLSDFSNNR